jgi:hypothetical protein
MNVVIVIPAFNEASTVGAVVTGARAHAPVIVIDDGSTDDTAARAAAAGAAVVRHERRRGKGAALATAVERARARGADVMLALDADGQHDPGDIPGLLEAARATPRALVIGSRVSMTAGVGVAREGADGAALPRGRAMAIHVTGFWLNWITGAAIADTQSGFRLYPLALFDDVSPRGGCFVFETAVLIEALRHGWQVREVPIRVVPCAARPSRFHPLGDGTAITAYVSGQALSRWGVELAAAAREVFGVFTHERRRARHGRVLEKSSAHAGTPSWGPALAVAAAEEIGAGASAWSRHPRLRRATSAALATLASPVLLALAGLAALFGDRALGLVERLVRAVYDQPALPPLEHRVGHVSRVPNEISVVP